MANLKKREIIILALAGLAVLYGVYEYFIADRLTGKKEQTSIESQTTETLTSSIA